MKKDLEPLASISVVVSVAAVDITLIVGIVLFASLSRRQFCQSPLVSPKNMLYSMFPNVNHVLRGFSYIKCLPTHLIFGTVKNIASVFHHTKNQVSRRKCYLKIISKRR